jgi:hypothetical protein
MLLFEQTHLLKGLVELALGVGAGALLGGSQLLGAVRLAGGFGLFYGDQLLLLLGFVLIFSQRLKQLTDLHILLFEFRLHFLELYLHLLHLLIS